jgi:hypothetical protein
METKKIKKLVISRETVKDLKLQSRVKTGMPRVTVNTTCDTEDCSGYPSGTFAPRPLTG